MIPPVASAARKPNHTAPTDTKRAGNQQPSNRHSSLLLHLRHSSTFCCQCGFSLTPNHASASHPIGRLYCRMCEHSACTSCSTSSPYIAKLQKNYVQVPADKTKRPTFGFVCCRPGCGWSQLIPKDDVTSPVSGNGNGKRAAGGLLTRMFKPARRNKTLMLDFRQHVCVAESRSPGSPCGHSCCDYCIKFQMNDGNQGSPLVAPEEAAENGEVDLVAQAFRALPVQKKEGVEKVHDLLNPNPSAPFRACQHHGPNVPMNCQVPHDDKPGDCPSLGYQKPYDRHGEQEQPFAISDRAQRLQATKNPSKPLPLKNFSKPSTTWDCAVPSSKSPGPTPAPAPAPARGKRHANKPTSSHRDSPASKPDGGQKRPRECPPDPKIKNGDTDPVALDKMQTALIGITITTSTAIPPSSPSPSPGPAGSNPPAASHNNDKPAPPTGGSSSNDRTAPPGLGAPSRGQTREVWSVWPQPVAAKPARSSRSPRRSRFTEHIQTYQRLQAETGLAGEHSGWAGKCELKRQRARKGRTVEGRG